MDKVMTTTAIPEAAFKLKSADVRDLTRELAEEFHSMEGSPTERDLNEKRVEYLDDRRAAGELVTFNWAIADVGSKRYRMNGQHSSEMLSRLNGEFPTGLKVHLDEYEVSNEHGLALLFRQFDARQSGRSPSDVAGAYQMLEEALRDVPKGAARLAVEGFAWHSKTVVGGLALQQDDRYDFFHRPELHAYIRWVGEVFSIKTPELKSEPIVGAMYATFDVNQTDARTFWDQVARGGAEYDDDAPASVLDAWLKKFKEDKLLTKPKPGQYYQGCIYAWNAFREGKSLKSIKFDASKGFTDPTH
jgi:hypothetical protein